MIYLHCVGDWFFLSFFFFFNETEAYFYKKTLAYSVGKKIKYQEIDKCFWSILPIQNCAGSLEFIAFSLGDCVLLCPK